MLRIVISLYISHLFEYLPEVSPYLALDYGFTIDDQGYEDVG